VAGTLEETTAVHCVTDFALHMPKVSGETALMQSLARRLQTPRGRVPWWPNYGTDIRNMLLSKVSPYQIVSSAIRECSKDERVENVDATATITNGGRTLVLGISVTTAAGPFDFTMTITEAAESLIELQKEAA
jgi:phage baseplate assembly protein W